MADEKPCPNCGHCPTCGRSNFTPAPYYPYYPQSPYFAPNTWPYRTWVGTGTVSSGGGIASSPIIGRVSFETIS